MQVILADRNRKIDYTLDLTFPDATSFKFATAPHTISGLGTYTNQLENVGEIRRTLESPVDRVSIGIQNKDRVLGQHVATYWQKWRKAEAVIGRYYRGGSGFAMTEWMERFRGAVQKPNANDLQVTMDIIPDTVSPGLIVANGGLGLLCRFVYKDAKTCGSTSSRLICNHMLKSLEGCDGDLNSHHFGGMEHRNNPDQSPPGGPGNPDDPPDNGGGSGPCPRLDQYVLVKGDGSRPVAKMVCFFTEEDELWNPITRQFHKTRRAKIIKRQPIFELLASNGASGYSSFKHPVLWYKEHATGEPVEKFSPGDPVLGWAKNKLVNTRALLARPSGSHGDVMKISMEDGFIYCYGDSEEKFIVCHNEKPVEGNVS